MPIPVAGKQLLIIKPEGTYPMPIPVAGKQLLIIKPEGANPMPVNQVTSGQSPHFYNMNLFIYRLSIPINTLLYQKPFSKMGAREWGHMYRSTFLYFCYYLFIS